MASTYTELFYHFVWATKERQPFITPEIEPLVYRQVRAKCEALRIRVHALNGMPDHIHLACTLPTTLAIADAMEQIKGTASHFINHQDREDWKLYWQPGYGVLTFAKRDLPQVVAYIDGQKRHHAESSLSPKMERLDESDK